MPNIFRLGKATGEWRPDTGDMQNLDRFPNIADPHDAAQIPAH